MHLMTDPSDSPTIAALSTCAAWVVHCDGSAMPNPGRMGLGAVLTAPDSARFELSQDTHLHGCNNEAELRALMAALEALRQHGATCVQLYCDNSIVVEQLGESPSRPLARLAELFAQARVMLASFEHVSLHWVPRHRNAQADTLARAALGMAPKAAPSARQAKRKR